ncbi:MAG: hypothetical protein WDM89_21125 [Rhizomicrobium sp.]
MRRNRVAQLDAPRIGGYWFGPSSKAREAASRIATGPSSSGNPCPRFTALCSTASADIWVKIVVPSAAKTGLALGIFTVLARILERSDSR